MGRARLDAARFLAAAERSGHRGRAAASVVTYSLRTHGSTVFGDPSYLDGPASTVVTTVTSLAASASEADIRRIVATIRFG